MKLLSRVLLLVAIVETATSGEQHIFPNSRIFPGGVTQTEPVVAVSPVNPLTMFVSSVTINTGNSFRSEGVYVTTNGGVSWFGSDTCTGEFIQNHGGDPGVAINSSNRLFITHIGSVFSGVFSHYSTNFGNTWSGAVTLYDQIVEDKGTTTIDNDPVSPFYGRLYAAFVGLNAVTPAVLFSASSNSGTSWTTPVIVNTSPPARCSGAFVQSGIGGKIYVCWAGLSSTFPFIEDFLGLASSTDGGATWSVSQNIYDVNGISGTLVEKSNIRVNGLPQLDTDMSTGSRRGWVYIVTTEKNLSPAGTDPDIILHRSTDGGATWSAGIRVNQDPSNNGKIQYFPALHVDLNGGVNILFYDDRNTSSDSAEVMLARSTDGGTTWSEHVISEHRFKPKPIAGGSSNYQGDHIALTSVGTTLWPFWMDDFSGLYQVWTAPVDVTALGVQEEESSLPSYFTVKQNYPNPFNPSTTIEFDMETSSRVTVRVFDLEGREVALLLDRELGPGSHKVTFASGELNLASGIYFYRVSGNGFVATRKMLLIR